MSIKSVFSTKNIAQEAIKDISEQLKGINVKMLLFFSSSNYDQQLISSLMQSSFEKSTVFGCSTSGELVSGKMLDNSIVAMAFDTYSIGDVKVEVLKDLNSGVDVEPAFSGFETYFGVSAYTMDIQKYVGLVLIDGLSKKEEAVMNQVGARTNIDFIGGSAGDDLKFEKTYVYADGKVYENAAILAILKPNCEFSIIKTQSFKVLDNLLVATKVIEEDRTVLEFNDKPATEAYAEALKIPESKVADYFMTNPTGLIIGESNIYVRSPQQIINNTEIMFYCNILEGMEVNLLESTDMILDTQKAIDDKQKEYGTIAGMINFHCILRTLELNKKGLREPYGNIFKDIPTIGFSTYGEEFIGHINQTATILVFKDTL